MFKRFAIYHVPQGKLAGFGARWLGWDIIAGTERTHPTGFGFDVEKLTRRPRRYGLHATIKPPFGLAADSDPTILADRLCELCCRTCPIVLTDLKLARLGRFLAIVDARAQNDLNRLAKQVVSDLDEFRAPPDPAELDRRRKPGLTESQERNLLKWGYPHVMDDFRFHITLTGILDRDLLESVETQLSRALAPILPRPYRLDSLSLAGEDQDGRFHEIQRFSLTGQGM